MKPRNREINIFNMSLLDILCGALGAFCFMMITLLPYYSSKPTNAPEAPQGLIDPKTLAEALDQIRQLKESLEKLQNYARNLEGQNNQQQQQISQLQQDNERLKADATKTSGHVGDLEMRNPFLAMIQLDGTQQDVFEMYWESDRVRRDVQAPFKLDPAQHQINQMGGDFAFYGPGFAYHGIRDSPPGEYRLFFKVIKHAPGRLLHGWVHVNMPDFIYVGPLMKTDRAQVAIPIATVQMGPAPEYNYKFDWKIPAEFNDEPDWKPQFPNRGDAGKQK